MAKPQLADRVNELVSSLFGGDDVAIPRGPKVINDAIHGNQHFARHEVAVINSPILQRLKKIKQTGLVYQVFPTAQHTRFEHSLGVATVSERIFNAIRLRAELEADEHVLQMLSGNLKKGDLAHLRLAALLHDVGHGLCSHAAEQIYQIYSDLEEFTPFRPNHPGEVLSMLMVTSETFRNWFSSVQKECGTDLDLSLVAQLILGKHPENSKYFLAQIISSPYDADKLDYIARDSYNCGLSLTVDLARFYSMIATAQHRSQRVLVLRNYVPLEQILFSKMTLFGSVYQHQKVKCLDHMLRLTVHHILSDPEKNSIDVGSRRIDFTDPVHYLYTTDDEFFNQFVPFGDGYVQEMLRNFRLRRLFVRALEISKRTIKNWEDIGRQTLVNLADDIPALLATERRIYEVLSHALKDHCKPGDFGLSVPTPPNLNTAYAYVQPEKDGPIEDITKFFPVPYWSVAYIDNKWRSYVYAKPDCAQAVRDAAIEILSDFELEVDIAESNRACRLR